MNERPAPTPAIRLSHALSELLGTFAMMTAGILGVALAFGVPALDPLFPDPFFRRALAGTLFAAGTMAVVYSPVGKISGAHLNPALSLALRLEGKIDSLELAAFSTAQLAGATAAALLAGRLLGEPARRVSLAMTFPAAGPLPTLLLEAAMTALLVATIFWFLHHERFVRWCGLAVGILIVLLVPPTAQLTGTSLNPARSFGPAIAAGHLDGQWPYLAGPILGAVAAVALARAVPLLRRPRYCKLGHPCHHENYLLGILRRLGIGHSG